MSQGRDVNLRETAQDYYHQGSHTSSQSDLSAIALYTNVVTSLDAIPKVERTEEDYFWQAAAYREIASAYIRVKDYTKALDSIEKARTQLSKSINKISDEQRTDQHYNILLFCDIAKWAVIMVKRKQFGYFQLFTPEEITKNLVSELEEKLNEYKKINADSRLTAKADTISPASVSLNLNAMFNRNQAGDNDGNNRENNLCHKVVI